MRGMVLNYLSFPDQAAEVLDANESRVRVRMNRPYAEWVQDS